MNEIKEKIIKWFVGIFESGCGFLKGFYLLNGLI